MILQFDFGSKTLVDPLDCAPHANVHSNNRAKIPTLFLRDYLFVRFTIAPRLTVVHHDDNRDHGQVDQEADRDNHKDAGKLLFFRIRHKSFLSCKPTGRLGRPHHIGLFFLNLMIGPHVHLGNQTYQN